MDHGFCAAFYKGTSRGFYGYYDRLIRRVDRGPYSHCELVFPDGIAASASWKDGGVRATLINFDSGHWDFIRLPLAKEPAARAWFIAHLGLGYDLAGNIHFVFGSVGEGKNRWFCSEAVLAALGFTETWRYGPNGAAALLRDLASL